MRILIVEDEADIQELLAYHVEQAGHDILLADDGAMALHLAQSESPDLILLDIMMPKLTGFEVCETLRAQSETKNLPIIMLTARGHEQDIVKGLNLGADDYVTKPFQPAVLLARIDALLRRSFSSGTTNAKEGTRLGPLSLHFGRREAVLGGSKLKLTFTEFQVLKALASKPGWVFTRYQIVDASKGEDHVVSERAVDVQIVGLRKKLGAAADLIETVRGVGYRLHLPSD
jgi:two-component system, OmpR family, alkaline phosphatase synthesis response regulator PhoP